MRTRSGSWRSTCASDCSPTCRRTTKLADAIILSDLYEKVAAAEKVAVPDDDMAPFTVKLDNATFDPKQPAEEAKRP